MITKAEIKLLQGLTSQLPEVCKHKDAIVIHSRWFALELDPSLVSKDVSPSGILPDEVKDWRDKVPSGDSAYGQAFRTVNEDDNTPVIKLVSDCGVARVHPSIYDVVTKHVPDGAFYVFEGKLANVAIRSKDIVVGCVAQIKIT